MRAEFAATAAAAVAAAVAYLGWLRLKRPSAARSTLRVIVASKASQKLQAAQKALGAAEVKAVDVPSGVADQPLGLEQTQLGARNRMWGCLDACESELSNFDLAVAIENGIVKSMSGDESETWFDVAVVYVRDLRTGAEALATSAGVRIASTYVGQWLEDGMEGTVAELIEADLGGDKQDPHATLTSGAFPRAALLEQAIAVAHAQLAMAPVGEAATMGATAADD